MGLEGEWINELFLGIRFRKAMSFCAHIWIHRIWQGVNILREFDL